LPACHGSTFGIIHHLQGRQIVGHRVILTISSISMRM
jgi:hypothetical protein